jgi:transposase
MRQKSIPVRDPAERVVKDIRRTMRRHFTAEDKIRIVLEGLRGRESFASEVLNENIRLVSAVRFRFRSLQAGRPPRSATSASYSESVFGP